MPPKSSSKRSAKRTKVAKKKGYGRRRTTAIMPNRLFRTFNYRKDFEGSTDRTNETWNPTGLVTYNKAYPTAGSFASIALLGSHCLTPLGNGTVIDTDGISTFISENFPTGLAQYGSFYEHAMVHGSSIRIDVLPFASTATAYRYVLLPIPVPSAQPNPNDASYPTGYTGNGWRPMASDTKVKLDLMTYYELSSQPRAKFGIISAPGAKNTVIKYKTMKTKTMLNVKDLRDCHDNFEMALPYNSGVSTDTPHNELASNCANLIPNLGTDAGQFKDFDTWIWYFRMFNIGQSGNDQSGLCSFSIRVKYMCELYDRVPTEIVSTQQWPID